MKLAPELEDTAFFPPGLTDDNESLDFNDHFIDWSVIPGSLDPAAGELDSRRASKKREQISSLILSSEHEIKQRSGSNLDENKFIVCDFGAGSGHLGLLLAYRNPDIEVVLVERKLYSVKVAEDRIRSCNLENASIFDRDIRDLFSMFANNAHVMQVDCRDPPVDNLRRYIGVSFKISFGVSLHSCGLLTDIALALCVEHRASFVLTPCCYGQITHPPPFSDDEKQFESVFDLSISATRSR